MHRIFYHIKNNKKSPTNIVIQLLPRVSRYARNHRSKRDDCTHNIEFDGWVHWGGGDGWCGCAEITQNMQTLRRADKHNATTQTREQRYGCKRKHAN